MLVHRHLEAMMQPDGKMPLKQIKGISPNPYVYQIQHLYTV